MLAELVPREGADGAAGGRYPRHGASAAQGGAGACAAATQARSQGSHGWQIRGGVGVRESRGLWAHAAQLGRDALHGPDALNRTHVAGEMMSPPAWRWFGNPPPVFPALEPSVTANEYKFDSLYSECSYPVRSIHRTMLASNSTLCLSHPSALLQPARVNKKTC